MSQSASQAAAFYRDVAAQRALWTLCDEVGFPQPMTSSGRRAQPFWSSRARVERIIATLPAYAEFEPHEVSWRAFVAEWAPELERAQVLVGVNWSGARATGYDLEPSEVVANVSVYLEP